jgi:uncharacterized protein (TIGR00645 family)
MRAGERFFQSVIFVSRWLVAPFLIGLIGTLGLLLYRFFADLYGLASRIASVGWHDLAVADLNLVDIALMANLVLIVIFSGYQNFVAKIERGKHPEWPSGLTDIDFSTLKHRVFGTVAAIAAIDGLAWYLDLEDTRDTAKLGWALGFPLMFVAALLMLALADRLSRDRDDARDIEPPADSH